VKKNDISLVVNRRELLTAMGATTLAMTLPLGAMGATTAAGKDCIRRQAFDLGWQFFRGEGEGFAAVNFDDTHWRSVDAPHDWSIENLPPSAENPAQVVGPFDRKSKGSTATGFTVGGEGWYRKHFRLSAPANGRVEILFEGVYMNSDVWLNGHHLGNNASGYTPFAYDLTPYLSADSNNVLAVRVRNLGENSRWYSGSGIYRHVWLDVLPSQSRIARWGIGVTTRRIMEATADIELCTKLEDLTDGLTLVSRIKDAHGNIVGELAEPATAEVKQLMTVVSPKLWSPERPSLYTLETELRRDETVLDRAANSFGVRIVTFDAERGMTINGVSTKLRGGCIHHDNGLLGACAYDAAEERKVLLLKARGYNAVRPSHNPFSTAFLNACDRHGMLVMAETFDVWREHKLPDDYAAYFDDHWRADLATMVLQNRNHPSIVLWSIGNEIPGRNSAAGMELQWQLTNTVHQLDPSRPVTAAINGFTGRTVKLSAQTMRYGSADFQDKASTAFLDVVGYNYKLADYEADHKLFPKRVFFGSESFPKDAAAIWELTDKMPWLIGDFVWTAMDYLGEAGVGGNKVLPAKSANNLLLLLSTWPTVISQCGDIDLIGQQNAASLARDVIWGVSPLEIAVQRPAPEGKVEVVRQWGWHDEQRSWTWPGADGKPLTVRIYTSGDRVELRLNGRTLESKTVGAADLKKIEFTVNYEPGALEAVAFRNDAIIARKSLTTVGKPAAIRLTPEHSRTGSGRGDIGYVAVEIIDAQGRVVPDTSADVQLAISGPAELAAFGSANPFAVGSFQAAAAKTFNGRALIVLRGKGKSGRVAVEARANGLKAGSTSMQFG
jgi:beta-galactosidase